MTAQFVIFSACAGAGLAINHATPSNVNSKTIAGGNKSKRNRLISVLSRPKRHAFEGDGAMSMTHPVGPEGLGKAGGFEG